VELLVMRKISLEEKNNLVLIKNRCLLCQLWLILLKKLF